MGVGLLIGGNFGRGVADATPAARVGKQLGPTRQGRYAVAGAMSSSATQRATPAG